MGDLLYGAPTLTTRLRAVGQGTYAAKNKDIELGLVVAKNTSDADQPLTIFWRVPGDEQPDTPSVTHDNTKGPSTSSVCHEPT